MKGLVADSIHAFRIYRRTPFASLITVGVLAIGLACVTASLSLYVDLVLRQHPGIEHNGRIVTIDLNGSLIRISLLERIAAEISSLEAVAGVQQRELEIGTVREPRVVELVTRDYFGGIRPKLALGRGFEVADHAVDAAPTVVISDDFWRERFARSPDVLGRVVEVPLQVDGAEGPTEYRIIGVMSPEMPGLRTTDVALWLPLEGAARLLFPPERLDASRRSMGFIQIIGRRARGASSAAVANELNARLSDFDEYYLRPGFTFNAIEGIVTDAGSHRDARRQMRLFLVGSLLLALVAAANVSLFLLARAPRRRRELGIRMSVGAPTMRLARQLASESSLLVLIAAALGLTISYWLSSWLRGLAFVRFARWGDVTLFDWRVLGFVGAFLVLVTLAVSLAPILGLKRLGIATASRQVAASATLAQRVAGTAQIAIAGALGGAGLAFAWYLASMMLAYPGYETDDLYLPDFSINGGHFVLDAADQERQRAAIESLPSVEGIAYGGPVPGSGSGRGWYTVADPEDPTREINFVKGTLDSRFIEMLGFRLLYGRAPLDNEVGVAVVNQTGARQYFGRENVVGESLPIGDRRGASSVVVGVLEDLSLGHPSEEVEPVIFHTAQEGGSAIVIQSSLPVAGLQRELESLFDSGALEFDAVDLIPLALLRSVRIAPDRARGFLTIATASLVVFLAAIGFYGTQRYLVAAGRREYAIRAALGAGPSALGYLVLRRGLALSLPGLVLGGLLAFIIVAWMRDDFVTRDVSPGIVAVAVVAGLSGLVVLATLGPARQACRTDPAPLLRED